MVVRPGIGGQHVRLAARYYEDETISRLSPAAELLFIRSLALAASLPANGRFSASLLPAICQGMRRKPPLIDELVGHGLWKIVDEGSSYQITNWLKYNPTAQHIAAASRLEEARREWSRHNVPGWSEGDPEGAPKTIEVDGKTKRTPRTAAEQKSDSRVRATEVNNLGDLPPPLGEGGRSPDLGVTPGVQSRVARTREADRSSSLSGGALDRATSTRPQLDPERDWRAERPVARKPPDLGDLRAKLAGAQTEWRKKGAPKPPDSRWPRKLGKGEDK